MADLRARLPQYQGDGAIDPASKVIDEAEQPFTLDQLKRYFKTSQELTQEARADSELSRDYYDGIQLTQEERAVLKLRRQPPIVINRVQRAVDGILGVVDQGKTDPRALMRNPPDDSQQQAPQQTPAGGPPQPGAPPPQQLDAGDVATMALRYIADTTHFPEIRMDVLENGIVEGCGAAVTEIDGDEVLITQIRWEEFFYDPYSRRHDFKDAQYLGIAKWMYSDQLARLYPEAKTDIDAYTATGNLSAVGDASWDDRPNTGTPWVDTQKKRVLVVDMYCQSGGQWYRAIFYAGALLEYAVSPYKDDKDQPACPIEGWSAYVNRKNDRYGVVKMMRDIQDEINMRRSKALHEINSRQIQQVDPGAPPADKDDARTEAARPDGVLPPGWNVVARSDAVANNIELLAEAKSEIERMAAAPAILGRQSADASGRAQQIRQQAGMTELARVLSRHANWQNRMYAQMWARARQFWNGPKWIRVTSDTDAPQYIRINEPTGAVPGIDPATGMATLVPGPPKNHIAKMDVDIVLEDVPDTATLEQEIFAELSQLAQIYGPQNVPFEIILEASQLPEKRKIIDKLKAFSAAQAPAQQAAQQASLAKGQADAAKTQADAAKSAASIELTKAQAGLAEVQTVAAAMTAHVQANAAAQLPPGFTLDSNNQHVPLRAPPPTPPQTPAA